MGELTAALPAVLELAARIAQAVNGEAVDPAAIKDAQAKAHTATTAALDAMQAAHDAARKAAEASLEESVEITPPSSSEASLCNFQKDPALSSRIVAARNTSRHGPGEQNLHGEGQCEQSWTV